MKKNEQGSKFFLNFSPSNNCYVIFMKSVFLMHTRQLLSKVTEVNDDPSKRTQELSSSARIKPRPKVQILYFLQKVR